MWVRIIWSAGPGLREGTASQRPARMPLRLAVALPVPLATPDEIAAHEVMLAVIAKASGGRVLWAALEVREPVKVPSEEDAPQRSSA